MNKSSLIPYLEICCYGMNTTAKELKDKLLTDNNIKDILSGDISFITIKTHILVWINDGKKAVNRYK